MLIGCNSSFFAVHKTASREIQPNCSWIACSTMSDAARFTG